MLYYKLKLINWENLFFSLNSLTKKSFNLMNAVSKIYTSKSFFAKAKQLFVFFSLMSFCLFATSNDQKACSEGVYNYYSPSTSSRAAIINGEQFAISQGHLTCSNFAQAEAKTIKEFSELPIQFQDQNNLNFINECSNGITHQITTITNNYASSLGDPNSQTSAGKVKSIIDLSRPFIQKSTINKTFYGGAIYFKQ
jgi:hypothetical protein